MIPSPEPVTVSTYDSPSGKMHIATTLRGLCRLTLPGPGREEDIEEDFFDWLHTRLPGALLIENYDSHREICGQLDAYFSGALKKFTIKTDLIGTEFQKSVWREIRGIPHGRVVSYGYIARKLGRPGSSRAVGAATGANPVPIVVPCHRVVGSGGALTGFGGGLRMKCELLELEGFRVVDGGGNGNAGNSDRGRRARKGEAKSGGAAPGPRWRVTLRSSSD